MAKRFKFVPNSEPGPGSDPGSYRRGSRLLPIRAVAPNILTVLGLCAGLFAMRFAVDGRWTAAVIAILAAAVFDVLDGRLARFLKGTSKFGAELDSLSDLACFGIAPTLLLYRWTLDEAGAIGWIFALIFTVCCALRLARFNIQTDAPDQSPWAAGFFIGVPVPAAAGIALLPMFLSFQLGDEILRSPVVVAPILAASAYLMISTVPTFSFKKLAVRRRYVPAMLLVVGLVAAALVSFPWLVLTVGWCIYLLSLPWSVRRFRQLQTGTMEPLDEADHD